MWNINRGFKFAHDLEDREEGKLGKMCRSGGKKTSHSVEGFSLLRGREA